VERTLLSVVFEFDFCKIFVGSYPRFDLVGKPPPLSFRPAPEPATAKWRNPAVCPRPHGNS